MSTESARVHLAQAMIIPTRTIMDYDPYYSLRVMRKLWTRIRSKN